MVRIRTQVRILTVPSDFSALSHFSEQKNRTTLALFHPGINGYPDRAMLVQVSYSLSVGFRYDTISNWGYQVRLFKTYCILCLKIFLAFANSIDPDDDMQHYVVFILVFTVCKS